MTFGNSTCVGAVAGVVCYGVFFNFQGSTANHPAVSNCSASENFDADITGIGVSVFSQPCLLDFKTDLDLATGGDIVRCLRNHLPIRIHSS